VIGPFTHLVLDLDGTLFNKNQTSTFAQLNRNAIALVAELIKVEPARAEQIMHGFLSQYGSTIQGLIQSRVEFNVEMFLTRLHDIDISDIGPDVRLREALLGVPHEIYLYTNCCQSYALRVLAQLGISDLVENIFDIHLSGYISKPAPASFITFLQHFQLDPAECLLVDDSKSNLSAAKQMGMKTLYINHDGDFAHEHFIDGATADLAASLSSFGLTGRGRS
jgi:putative hydrolase of the HAD superfamily